MIKLKFSLFFKSFQKIYEIIKKELGHEGYNVKESGWYWNKYALIWFKIDNAVLSKFVKHEGPPVEKIKHVEQFREKHKGHEIIRRDDRLYAILPRGHKALKDYIKNLIKTESEIRKRAKKIKIVKV